MADQASSIWHLDELKPFESVYMRRKEIFQRRESFYDGTAYGAVDVAVTGKGDSGLKQAYANMLGSRVGGINTKIQGLIDPISSAVDIDWALVPGGWQLHPESQQHEEAVQKLFSLNQGMGELCLYTFYGAAMGNGSLLVVDDRQNGRVDIQALRPDSVVPIYDGGRSLSRKIIGAIVVEDVMGDDGKMVEMAQVMNSKTIIEFKNGEQVGIRVNQLGFVPLVDQPFLHMGKDIGGCSFNQVVGQLKAVNQTATALSENIRKNSDPQWVVMTDDDLPEAPIKRSSDKLWKLSAQGGVEAIVASLDIEGVNNFIDGVYEKLKRKLPQFMLYELVGMNRVSTASLQVQLHPLTLHINSARTWMDMGVVKALQFAGQVAAAMGLDSDLIALNDPNLRLDEQRRVIPMDRKTQLEIEMLELQVATQRAVLEAQMALSGGDNNG